MRNYPWESVLIRGCKTERAEGLRCQNMFITKDSTNFHG